MPTWQRWQHSACCPESACRLSTTREAILQSMEIPKEWETVSRRHLTPYKTLAPRPLATCPFSVARPIWGPTLRCAPTSGSTYLHTTSLLSVRGRPVAAETTRALGAFATATLDTIPLFQPKKMTTLAHPSETPYCIQESSKGLSRDVPQGARIDAAPPRYETAARLLLCHDPAVLFGSCRGLGAPPTHR